MMAPTPPPIPHPLDLEIAGLVEGVLEPDSARTIEAHIADCLLCRIKRQRFIGRPRVELTPIEDVVVPNFVRVQTTEPPGEAAAPGELWTTRSADSLLVLIRSVDELEVTVVPVVVDVEVADDECTVIPARLSPIGIAIAVYNRLRVSVSASALEHRVVPLQEVDLLEVLQTDTVIRGSAIEGPADPRLEIRQYLADCLTLLTPHQPESLVAEDVLQPGPSKHLRQLADALAHYRPSASVEPFTRLRVSNAAERRWVGIARIDELGVTVLAIDAPTGLRTRADFITAHTILTRCNGTALAVAASGGSELCNVFDAPGLFGATHLPEGEFGHLPAISGMPLEDAIAKYLEAKVRILLGTGSTTRGVHVRVQDVLARQVGAAIDSAVQTGAKIEAKKKGYRSLATSVDALTDVLSSALSGAFDPDQLAEIPWEPDQ